MTECLPRLPTYTSVTNAWSVPGNIISHGPTDPTSPHLWPTQYFILLRRGVGSGMWFLNKWTIQPCQPATSKRPESTIRLASFGYNRTDDTQAPVTRAQNSVHWPQWQLIMCLYNGHLQTKTVTISFWDIPRRNMCIAMQLQIYIYNSMSSEGWQRVGPIGLYYII